MVACSVRSLLEAIEPRRKFIEYYFRTVSKLLDCSVCGIFISHGSSPWGAIRLFDEFGKEEFEPWLRRIAQQSYIEQNLNLEVRGELIDNGKALPSVEVLPIQSEHGLLGTLVFAPAKSGGFDDIAHATMNQLQQQMRPVMQLLLARQGMEQISAGSQSSKATDQLTGLYNFEFLIAFLQQQLLYSFRQRIPVGLLFLEVDGLQQLNSTMGWETGDLVLSNVATWLLTHTRGSDLVARYNGDSFALVLPNTDLKGVRVLGEKLKAEIVDEKFAAGVHKHLPKISARIGCAVSKGEDLNPESILQDAKEDLYASKVAK
jgi:diguanylate cyclase (GGDEF)-like protein